MEECGGREGELERDAMRREDSRGVEPSAAGENGLNQLLLALCMSYGF